MTDAVRAAYDAPFPDDSYCAGPRAMPGLVPTTPDNPASAANRAAWKALCDSTTPMLVAFSDRDPITGPMGPIFAGQMRGAQGVEHPVIANAGHFLQEDAGEEFAEAIVRFLRQPSNPFAHQQATLIANVPLAKPGWRSRSRGRSGCRRSAGQGDLRVPPRPARYR